MPLQPRFTGKERDAETGLDYFGARYYSAAQGRFTSPDWSSAPEPVPFAQLDNPQTLNLYVYARNNPIAFYDPDGHCATFCQVMKGIGIGIGALAINANPMPLSNPVGTYQKI
jgi:RHS repeat-associated protein